MAKKIKIIFVLGLIIVFFPSSDYVEAFEFDYNEIFDNHKLVRLIIDAETGALIRVNEAAVAYYGYTSDELLKMNILDINTLSADETRREWEAAANEERNHFNFRHRLASGEIRDVEVYSYPFINEKKAYLYSIIIDITEVVAAEQLERNRLVVIYLTFLSLGFTIGWLIFFAKSKEKYKKLSCFDQLTKVYSRHYLNEWKNDRTDISIPLTIVLLDIDRFKQINDSHGHLIGDQVLVEVAEVLKTSVRDNDLVVRYGGDEFILILEKTTEEASQKIMKRIKDELLNMNKFEFLIEVSYGIVEIKSKLNIFDAIGLADEKMYKMKKLRYEAICALDVNL